MSFKVKNTNQSDISNLFIKTDYTVNETIFNFDIKYVDENTFYLDLEILDGENLNITFFNKYSEDEKLTLNIVSKYFKQNVICPFHLIYDNISLYNTIPKIIHQSYKNKVKKNMFNATNTWKMMNINYSYKYWNDEECYNFILENFDSSVKDAYNMLYAGACKSDIFRLCVLYIYGGLWTDISSICKYPIDKLIDNKNNMIIVKDNPSQVKYGNIYQAFIITEPRNELIKKILDFTVDRVLNNEKYNKLYPYYSYNTIAITGPTIFATALNIVLGREQDAIIHDKYISFNSYNIKLIDHYPGKIIADDFIICETKYNNWQNDRTNKHYSQLFHEGFVYKKKVDNVILNENLPTLYQIWIQDKYVSNNMYNAIQTFLKNNTNVNYVLLTNERIIKMIQYDEEFPLLFHAYNKIKPFAFKSDVIRYYVLYKYGGIYADIDFICMNKIDDLYNDYDLVLCSDIDNFNVSNGFICSKKGNTFLKYVVEKVIDNIINETKHDSNLSITGPIFFRRCFSTFFNITTKKILNGSFVLNNIKLKILKYDFNLPLPKGSWINSSRKYYVSNGNILNAECIVNSFGNMFEKWVKNRIQFSFGDVLSVSNGKIINNKPLNYNLCEGSGFVIDNERLYFISKYNGYNDERLILDGNDFAKMYHSNDIFENT
jgi:mannosyltransferase OCH1-like enzyme